MSITRQTVQRSKLNQPPIAIRRTAHGTSFLFSDYLFWLLMLLVSVPNVLEIWGIDTIFKPYRVVSMILAGIMIPQILRETWVTRRFSVPLFTALSYVSIVTVVFSGAGMFSMFPLIIGCLSLFFATYAVTSRKSLLIGLMASLLSFFFSAGYGLFIFSQGQYRLNGLFTNPNSLGYAGCFALLVIVNRHFAIPAYARLLGGLGTIGVIVLTGSRGSLLALFVAFAAQLWRQPRLFRGLVLGGVLLLLASIFIAPEIDSVMRRNQSLLNRYSSRMVEEGGSGRLALAKAALEVSVNHGFVGVGLGQFRLQYFTKHFQIFGTDGQIQRLGVHNTYVSLLCEWGIVGFTCFALIFLRLVRDSKFMNYGRDWILGYVCTTLFMGISTDLLTDVHYWVMLGTSVQFLRFTRSPGNRQHRSPRCAT